MLTYFIREKKGGQQVTQPHNWCLRLIAYCLPRRSGKNVSFIRDVFRSRIGRGARASTIYVSEYNTKCALPSHIKHSSIGFKEALNYTDDKYFPVAGPLSLSSIRQREDTRTHRDGRNTITFNKNDLPFSSSIINKLQNTARMNGIKLKRTKDPFKYLGCFVSTLRRVEKTKAVDNNEQSKRIE